MPLSKPSTPGIFRGAGLALAVVLPLLLLADPAAVFGYDWNNHLWLTGYYGEYFRQHGAMPTVINFAPAVGIPQPVFYGYLLYPVLGFFSAGLGAALALRLGVLLLMALQFSAVFGAGMAVLKHRGAAYVASSAVAWATYSLTNLYSRGAIPEFFATGFLVIAVAQGAAAVVEPDRARRRFLVWLAVIFLVLTAGSHPPTAVVSAALVALLGAVLAPGFRRGERKILEGAGPALLAGIGAGALLLAPWIYAVARFGGELPVGKDYQVLAFFPDRSDSLWGRFAPFPLDLASRNGGATALFAPYLETQVNVVLLLLLAWNLAILFFSRRPARDQRPANSPIDRRAVLVLVAAIGWFALLAAVSVSPRVAGPFAFVAPYIQFAYRLVSHCNVALLIAVFASGALVADVDGYRRFLRPTHGVLAACLCLALGGLAIKLAHANAVASRPGPPQFALGGDRSGLVVTGQGELALAYNTAGKIEELREPAGMAAFPIGRRGESFGEVAPAKIELGESKWIVTTAVIFPWTTVYVDGQPWTGPVARWHSLLALHLSAGSHQLQPVWQPGRLWLALHRVSQGTLVAVVFATLLWAAKRQRAGTSPSSPM